MREHSWLNGRFDTSGYVSSRATQFHTSAFSGVGILTASVKMTEQIGQDSELRVINTLQGRPKTCSEYEDYKVGAAQSP